MRCCASRLKRPAAVFGYTNALEDLRLVRNGIHRAGFQSYLTLGSRTPYRTSAAIFMITIPMPITMTIAITTG